MNLFALLVWLVCLGFDIYRYGKGESPSWGDVFIPEGLIVFMFFMDWIKEKMKYDY